MANSQKMKIYTHRKNFLTVRMAPKNRLLKSLLTIADAMFYVCYYTGLLIIKLAGWLIKGGLSTCYHTGNLIIASLLKTTGAAKKDFVKTKEILPKRFKLIFHVQFKHALLSFLLFAFIGWGFLATLNLAAKALDIKGKILHTALIGNLYLTQAKDALANQDLTQANDRFSRAYQTFTTGQSQIQQSGQLLNQLLKLVPQKNDADRLLEAAGLISRAGENFINIETSVKTLKLTTAGIAPTGLPTASVFKGLSELLDNSLAELNQAQNDIGQINVNNLPKSNQASFLDLKSKLSAANVTLGNLNQVFTLAENILIGNKNLLVLFENNNELRAGGGFMGTYGDLKLLDGQVKSMTVSSIYDLDGQLTETIQPPQPVLNLTDRWFLRDSNWFFAWADNAKKIVEFYEKEGGETPDMVSAVTPNIIIDWLKITGPIDLPKYGVTLTADNFIEQSQVASTMSNDLPTNSPKQILADLVPILLQKLTALDKSAWPQVIYSLQNNLNNKQIVLYSRDDATEQQLEAFNWAGDVSPTDRDYLAIVSSNLGGTKTDLEVDQTINLTTSLAPDGSLTDELEITRTNKMPQLDQTNNLSYLRVYVPQGAKLISNLGFDYKNLDYPEGEKYTIDDDVFNLQKNSVKDVVTETTIGQEAGKTYFGNWLNVLGGESKTIKLVYQLPFKLNDIDRYSLLLQKQIGAQNSSLHWSFNFPGYQIAWKNFDANQLNTDNLASDIIVDKDYFLGTVLQKR